MPANLSLMTALISNSLLGAVFGGAMLLGIFLIGVMVALIWYIGLPMDACVILLLPLLFIFAGIGLIPMDIMIMVWFGIGVVVYMFFRALIWK